ncbi:MAG TPA: hypothetical protein VN428_04620, partial [Bryobacteraceae bacterium]|nr:hypothetical protein [Bryobacteraceae bacterium]
GTEEEEEWREFRDECRETLQPVGAIELGYADEFAASRWRLQRCLGIETSIFDYQFAMQKIYDVEKCATMDGVDRTGMAFKSAKDDLTALGRFETRIRRSGERAFANLLKYQSMRQNEPSKADARVREPAPQPVQPGESSAAVPQNKPEIPPAPADPTGPPTTQAPAGDVLQNKSKQPAAPDVFTESTMAQALPATVNPQNESNEGAPSLNPQAP